MFEVIMPCMQVCKGEMYLGNNLKTASLLATPLEIGDFLSYVKNLFLTHAGYISAYVHGMLLGGWSTVA